MAGDAHSCHGNRSSQLEMDSVNLVVEVAYDGCGM